MKRAIRTTAVLIWAFVVAGLARAQNEFPPAGDESANYKTEVVSDGLDNPVGLTVWPAREKGSSQTIYFAESGAGRILRFSTSEPSKTQEVVTGLRTDVIDGDLGFRLGPWSLGFITPTKLAVLGGSGEEASDRISVFIVSDDEVRSAKELDHQIEMGTGVRPIFPGVVLSEIYAYLSHGLADNTGYVFRSALIANRMDDPRQFFSNKNEQSLEWPTGLCLSPPLRVQFLVVGFLGQMAEDRDSRVAFVQPSNGSIALKLFPGLFDILGLAYSPSGRLYVVDFAAREENSGGVYRLDDVRLNGYSACRAVKIASIVRPTSLAFDASGNLYVTSFGTGTNSKQGTITKIEGDF